ncbi:MAG: 50S ribosomal protein L1 [Candidatus Lokiarchaeota archaeon]|nr:50S ribosomal protein L1 [Candidatus Lokiarchaeota archaeon]
MVFKMPLDSDIIENAVKKAKENKFKGKFTHTVDLFIILRDIDLKQPQNRINTEHVLPNGLGNKKSNICVLTTNGDFALRAKQEDLTVVDKEGLNELQQNRSEARKLSRDHDFFIASVEAMPLVAKSLGPVLGPKGKMPLGPPRGSGIVPPTTEIKSLKEKYEKTIRLKMRKALRIYCPVGDEEMSNKELTENIESIVNFLERNLEKGLGNFKNIYLKTTMGHPVKIEI